MDIDLVGTLARQLSARLVETHISWVLLTPEFAWKIKKPVQLGFLDFGTLDARHRMCDEELRLNRRLAPSLYLDVVPITGTPQAPRLGGTGTPIEWALRMRRFPDGALLSEHLERGALTPALIDRLAHRLAAFHRDAPVADTTSPYGTPERIDADMQALIERLGERLRGDSAGEDLRLLRHWASGQARALRDTWLARRRGGWVREGHGDLHLANAVVLDDAVTAFDCIEFDPALRWTDVQADIGFTVMDLLAHRRSDLAFRLLDGYLSDTGDHGGLAVLPYYIVYRALVRALVAALKPPAAGTPDYLGLALRWLQRPSARLMITHGVSGSGKSHATERLLESAGAIRLRSDVERKRLFGLAALDPSVGRVPGSIYDADATQRTYARLLQRADAALAAGWPVIVDATFLRASERTAFRHLAQRHGVPFTILSCEAPPLVLQQRVAARRERSDDPSEADVSILQQQLRAIEPLDAIERRAALALDTSLSPDISAVASAWAAR
jgi:aminoglycoside phosphotransferase family enzyme/predicted kinase